MSDLWKTLVDTAPFSFLLLMLAPFTHAGSLVAVVIGWMGRRRAGFITAGVTLAACAVHVLFSAGGAVFLYVRGDSAVERARRAGSSEHLQDAAAASVQDFALLSLCTLIVPVLVSVFALGLRSTEGQRG